MLARERGSTCSKLRSRENIVLLSCLEGIYQPFFKIVETISGPERKQLYLYPFPDPS